MIAVDWGTSSLRGARLDEAGAVREERAFPRGILTVPAGGFPAVLQACFGDWLGHGELCLISGMAGSRQGWVEAAYCACPAGADDIAARLAWIRAGRIAIVPGLRVEADGAPDVMRGEETQVFGALSLLGLAEGLLVLPGTHSKWVRVSSRRVTGFATAMTGEVYALLRQHSILARGMPPADGDFDGEAFDSGVAHALASPGLLQAAFSVRTRALFDRLDMAQGPSYLSGIVIGEELRSEALPGGSSVVIVGAPALTAPYARALSSGGVASRVVGAEATWRGLHDIARTL